MPSADMKANTEAVKANTEATMANTDTKPTTDTKSTMPREDTKPSPPETKPAVQDTKPTPAAPPPPKPAVKVVAPSVGDIMWYWPHGDLASTPPRPLAAIVTRVMNDSHVMLSVWTHRGQTTFIEKVALIQRGDDLPEDHAYCEWPLTPDENKARIEQDKAKAEKAEVDAKAKTQAAQTQPTARTMQTK